MNFRSKSRRWFDDCVRPVGMPGRFGVSAITLTGQVRTSMRAGVAAGVGFAVCLASLPPMALAQSAGVAPTTAGAATSVAAAGAAQTTVPVQKLTAKQRRKNENDAED